MLALEISKRFPKSFFPASDEDFRLIFKCFQCSFCWPDEGSIDCLYPWEKLYCYKFQRACFRTEKLIFQRLDCIQRFLIADSSLRDICVPLVCCTRVCLEISYVPGVWVLLLNRTLTLSFLMQFFESSVNWGKHYFCCEVWTDLGYFLVLRFSDFWILRFLDFEVFKFGDFLISDDSVFLTILNLILVGFNCLSWWLYLLYYCSVYSCYFCVWSINALSGSKSGIKRLYVAPGGCCLGKIFQAQTLRPPRLIDFICQEKINTHTKKAISL